MTEFIENLELLTAVTNGDLLRVQELLKGNSDPNVRDSKQQTPLMIAATAGNVPMIRLLIRYQPSMDLKDSQGQTALRKAVDGGQVHIVWQLLRNHANQEIRDNKQISPFIAAFNQENEMIAFAFLSAKADPNTYISYQHEETLLMSLSRSGNTGMALLLLGFGADPNLCKTSDQLPLANAHSARMVRLLYAFGAIPSKTALSIIKNNKNNERYGGIVYEMDRAREDMSHNKLMQQLLHVECIKIFTEKKKEFETLEKAFIQQGREANTRLIPASASPLSPADLPIAATGNSPQSADYPVPHPNHVSSSSAPVRRHSALNERVESVKNRLKRLRGRQP